jgi:hypothetical protein
MVYMPTYPSHLFFYCDTPPSSGGETPIVLSNVVYEKINAEFPEFVKELEEKGIRYTRVMPFSDDLSSVTGISWKKAFQTDNRREVEEKCKNIYEKIEWLDDGSLRTISFCLPAVKLEERTSKWTWFNQIVVAFFGWLDSRNFQDRVVTFGDGTPFDKLTIKRCFEILKENCVSFKWQKGDILFIDNLLVLHARNSFKPPRRILAALFE